MANQRKKELSKAEIEEAKALKMLWIKKKQQDKEYVQEYLGELMGCTQGNITQYMNGLMRISDSTLFKFAFHLNFNPEDVRADFYVNNPELMFTDHFEQFSTESQKRRFLATAFRYHSCMNIKEIRIQNLLHLIEGSGSMQALAERAQRVEETINANYLSQLKNSTKGMGDRYARKLESALGLPTNWMDSDHNETGTGNIDLKAIESALILMPRDERVRLAAILVDSLRG